MTIGKTDEEQELEEADPLYTIKPQIIEAQGRSVSLVVGDRLCEAAFAKMKSPDAWRTMTYKELRKLAKDTCGNQEGYITAQLPVVEAVFKLLLVASRDTLSLTEIHERLSAIWLIAPWPRHIGRESLQRVLDNSVRHGILRIEEK
jgi:hypothetical protein